MQSLTDYAADHPSVGRKCSICELPTDERQQINAARADRVAVRIIADWLNKERGFKVSQDMLYTHWSRNHEERHPIAG
ncbi:MAG: hypothetical protein NVS3B24_24300 [Candidatus Dormibacteria bacterium]